MNDHDIPPASTRLMLASLATAIAVDLPAGADPGMVVSAAAPLDLAGPGDIAFLAEGADRRDIAATRAGACFVASGDVAHVPPSTVALVVADPWAAFRRVVELLAPRVGLPPAAPSPFGIDPRASVHPDARLESNVSLDAGVVVGAGVELGSGTRIGANSVIGAGVRIGRGCAIDAHVTIANALIGDRVSVHAGARLGVSGSGPDRPRGEAEPIGRVIIQDDVEIGAGTIVERGSLADTTIGERAKLAAQALIRGGATIDRHAIVRGAAFS